MVSASGSASTEPEPPSTTGISPTPSTTSRTLRPSRIVPPSTKSRFNSKKCGRSGSTLLSPSTQKSCCTYDFLTIAAGILQRRFYMNLVNEMGYLMALARADLSGHLDYFERNIVEKLFQTYTMHVGRFHETWNGSQPSAEHWLTAYTPSYNSLRSHQALENNTDRRTRTGGINLAVPWRVWYRIAKIIPR